MVFLFRMNYRFLPILTARRFLSPFFLKGLLLFLLTHITVQKFQAQLFILKGVLLQELVFYGTRSCHWDVGHSLQYWPSLLFAPSLADLHVLLLEDLLILLQKQDDKYVLKCLGTTVIAGYQDTKVILLFLSLSTLSVSSFLIGSYNQLTCSVTLYGNSLRLSEFGLCGCFFFPSDHPQSNNQTEWRVGKKCGNWCVYFLCVSLVHITLLLYYLVQHSCYTLRNIFLQTCLRF